MIQKKNITICACVSRSFIDAEKVVELATILKKEGCTVTVVPDLCRQMMEASPATSFIASSVILACYPRAVHAHLHRLDLTVREVLDIRNNSYEEILGQLSIQSGSDRLLEAEKESLRKEIAAMPVEAGSDAWYPVLDKERCTECGKCRDFCLFGVYAVTDGHIKVVQPQNCKNNCPACARICPGRAIIFPKYEKSPINGGLEIEEQLNAETMDNMYKERLKLRLEQRRAGISLLKNNNKQ